MMYWDGTQWLFISPGITGQTLTFCNGIPIWGPCNGQLTVTTAPVTDITHNSAVSGGNVMQDGGIPVTARGVVWHTLPNPDLNTNTGFSTDGQGTGTFISNILNLTPLTSYYVRAYATNAEGTAYGNQRSFQTIPENGNGNGDGLPCPGFPTVSDADGNLYNTVKIGNQCWIKENLRTSKYSNGNPILTGLSESEWQNTTSGAYAIFDHEHPMAEGIDSPEQMASLYGKLYNWHAVNDSRGLCPAGWHVPTDSEWNTLTTYVGSINSSNIGNQLKSCRQLNSPLGEECDVTDHPMWYEHSTHHGTDDFGFLGYPAGMREYLGGTFSFLGFSGYWWSSTQDDSGFYAWYRDLFFNSGSMQSTLSFKNIGISVRCIKD
ncbi:MAG: hypothetical protein EA393_06445 [Bacteroidetes bacterium]|nr:MAG: hypothetical protein EA393_06445 [Bacteroidota bacterium]